jgi:hypothetical protein
LRWLLSLGMAAGTVKRPGTRSEHTAVLYMIAVTCAALACASQCAAAFAPSRAGAHLAQGCRWRQARHVCASRLRDGPATATTAVGAREVPGPDADFVLELDERCRVTVVRRFLPPNEADRLLSEVPVLCSQQLTSVGSRLSAVYFDEPARDYFFSGRRWSMDGNAGIPGAIAAVKREAVSFTGQPFNGAVVNVYGTSNAQIKWHDDGEYS